MDEPPFCLVDVAPGQVLALAGRLDVAAWGSCSAPTAGPAAPGARWSCATSGPGSAGCCTSPGSTGSCA